MGDTESRQCLECGDAFELTSAEIDWLVQRFGGGDCLPMRCRDCRSARLMAARMMPVEASTARYTDASQEARRRAHRLFLQPALCAGVCDKTGPHAIAATAGGTSGHVLGRHVGTDHLNPQ